MCNEVVVADDPMFPSDELPNGADGAACSVGKRPEPTPWATPTCTPITPNKKETQQTATVSVIHKKKTFFF